MRHFLDHQERNRKLSYLLVGVFAANLVILLGATYFGTQLVNHYLGEGLIAPEIACAIVGVIILSASFIKHRQLAQGGTAVALSIGGTLISHNPSSREERRLLNIVDEMAVAASMPSPCVYILKEERGINAFTSGTQPSDAAILVTQGALDSFDREMMESVIAHEFGHICNGDVQLNYRMLSLLFGIDCIAILGQRLMGNGHHVRRSFRSNRAPVVSLAALGFFLFIFGLFGRVLADMTKQLVNQKREYLADAMAVEFTRNPNGLIKAFNTMTQTRIKGRVTHPFAREVAHLFFSQAVGKMMGRNSHPPIDDRIARLDSMSSNIEAELSQAKAAPTPREQPAFTPQVNQLATMTLLGIAQQRLRSLPSNALHDAHDSSKVVLVLLAILVANADEGDQENQEMIVRKKLASDQFSIFSEYLTSLRNMHYKSAIALVEICAPALSTLGKEQQQEAMQLIHQVATDDGEISFIEWALMMLVEHQLNNKQKRPKPSVSSMRLAITELANALFNLDPRVINRREELGVSLHREFGIKPSSIAPSYSLNHSQLAKAVRLLKGAPHIARLKAVTTLSSYASEDTKSYFELLNTLLD